MTWHYRITKRSRRATVLLDNKKENQAYGDAPVMMMPDGLTYFHVEMDSSWSVVGRVSPNTVVEVST
jgi:hypothetical protein